MVLTITYLKSVNSPKAARWPGGAYLFQIVCHVLPGIFLAAVLVFILRCELTVPMFLRYDVPVQTLV
jgi:hypothetical protein